MQMAEVVVVCSNKDVCGLEIIDITTGSSVCSSFKNCISDAGMMCKVGSGLSSFSGVGSSGDFVAVAQSKKPVIHMWQWGKPNVQFQCHLQEICTSIASDIRGEYIFAGTKNGWIYCWEVNSGELVSSWQAHFKSVNRLMVSKNGQLLISASEDGMCKAWEVYTVLDAILVSANVKRTQQAFRTWNAHSLTIKDMYLLDCLTTLRVLTCSLDRSVANYDVFVGKQCQQFMLPQSLEAIVCNPTEDLACVGATNGSIFILDFSVLSIAMSAAHAQVNYVGDSRNLAAVKGADGLPAGSHVLEGHTRPVTSLCFSMDNRTLISGSEDGTVRMWDVWSRQCLRECKPFQKHSITAMMIVTYPELIQTGVTKPTVAPAKHLRKYLESGTLQGKAMVASIGPTLMSNRSFALQRDVPDVPLPRPYSAAAAPMQPRIEHGRIMKGGEHVDAEAVAASLSNKRPAAVSATTEAESEFVAFSGTYGEEDMAASSSEGEGEEKKEPDVRAGKRAKTASNEGESELNAQLQEALSRVQTLEADNQRWKSVCMGLKKHLAQASSGGNDDEGEEDDFEEEKAKQQSAAAAEESDEAEDDSQLEQRFPFHKDAQLQKDAGDHPTIVRETQKTAFTAGEFTLKPPSVKKNKANGGDNSGSQQQRKGGASNRPLLNSNNSNNNRK